MTRAIRAMSTMRRRYHIHLPGILFVGVTALLGIGAINSQNNMLFLVFGLCLGAMIVSGLLSGSMMMGLRLRRLAIPDAVVGQPLRIGYLIRSQTRHLPAHALLITERFHAEEPPPFPIRNACVVKVGPGERIKAYSTTTPTQRGKLSLSRIQASSSFPFGIFRKSVSIDQPAEILVLPRTRPVRRDLFYSIASHRFSASAPATNRRGIGNEFWGIREYVPGDSARLIAWRSAARTGELVVRQHTESPLSRIRVVLLFAPDRPEDHHEAIIEAGASTIRGAIESGIPVALSIPQADIHTQMGVTPAHLHTVLTILAGMGLGSSCANRAVQMPPNEDAGSVVLTNAPIQLDSPRTRVITLDQLPHALYTRANGLRRDTNLLATSHEEVIA